MHDFFVEYCTGGTDNADGWSLSDFGPTNMSDDKYDKVKFEDDICEVWIKSNRISDAFTRGSNLILDYLKKDPIFKTDKYKLVRILLSREE